MKVYGGNGSLGTNRILMVLFLTSELLRKLRSSSAEFWLTANSYQLTAFSQTGFVWLLTRCGLAALSSAQ